MKHKPFFIFASCFLIIVGIQISSCNSNEEALFYCENDAAFENLTKELDEYTNFFKLNHEYDDNKSRFLGLNKFIKAIKADFLAAGPANPNDNFLRIIAFSPGASVKKWHEQKEAERDQIINEATTLAINNLLNIYLDSLTLHPNNIGYAHNAIILKMYADGRTGFNSTEQLAGYIYHSIHSLNISSTYATQSDIDELTNKIDHLCDSIIEDNDSLTFINLKIRFPALNNRLNIFENYCSNVSIYNQVNDIRSYTSGFINIINASQLSPLEKTAISKSISLYPKSYHMWIKLDSIMSN